MREDELEAAAEALAPARTNGEPIDPVPESLRPRDEDEAYAVQQRLHERLTLAGHGPLAGHKIGCTTQVMQRYLNIPQPCAGGVFERTVHHGEGRIFATDYRRVGVECEIAVRLARDLDTVPASHAELSDALACCMAAMEIVDDRYRDYTTLGVMTLIADDFFNAGAVVVEPGANWRNVDLASVSGRMWINDREAGHGTGADIMGHPLNALAWLVERYAGLGLRLRAGDLVLLGSVVQTQWLEAGDEVRIEVGELGSATLVVS